MPLPDELSPLDQFLDQVPPPTITIVLASDVGGNPLFTRLRISAEVGAQLRSVPRQAVRRMRSAVIQPYEVGYRPESHELLRLELGSHDAVRAVVGSCPVKWCKSVASSSL